MQQHTGNLIAEVKEGVIIHQVNAQGVMGSGIAAQLRAWYPKVFEDYALVVGQPYTQPDSGLHQLGRVIVTPVSEDLVVLSIIGQQFFGRDQKRYTSYDALDVAFGKIRDEFTGVDADFHFPLIGCGLGGADWTIVSAIIERHLPTTRSHLWTLPTWQSQMAPAPGTNSPEA